MNGLVFGEGDSSKTKNNFVQEKIINEDDDIEFKRMQHVPKSISLRAFGGNIGSDSAANKTQRTLSKILIVWQFNNKV